jgi:hypothetical protein
MAKLTVEQIRKKVDDYLMNNHIERGKPNCYKPAAEVLGVDSEYVRDRHRKLRAKGLTFNSFNDSSLKENVKTGEADFECKVKKRIKTLDDLIQVCQIDTNIWNIISYEINKWEVGRKEKEISWDSKEGRGTGRVKDTGKIFVEPLYQVKAKLSRRNVDKDLGKQKEVVMDELRAYSVSSGIYDKAFSNFSKISRLFDAGKKDCALEINIPDLHLGKLAWKEESGEDYDIKIAIKRYKDAVYELIGRTNINNIDRFILVVGHDFLNVDGKNNQTTAGTPQSSDSRFAKMVKLGKKLLIETIDELSTIALVDVMVVPGNHDSNSMLMMGDILDAWYHTSTRVNVYNDPGPRKYYQYGVTGLMYAHGHNEKMDEMGRIFSTENKELWYHTTFHRVHMGHFHHSKQLQYKDVQEYPGCIVKIINSLSGTDAYHSEKAFLSLKGAEAFLYHKDKGLIANYYYYV